MLKKAQAWDKYNEAAILEMYLKVLPDVAKAVSEPLSKVDKIVVVGGDKSLGTTKITAQVAEVLAQMPEVVQSLDRRGPEEIPQRQALPRRQKPEK